MCAVSKLLCHCNAIIVLSRRERACAEGKTIVLVWHSIEHPLDILCSAYDAWQTEDRIRRVVRVYAHIDVIFIAYRHDGFEPVFHVFLQLMLVYSIIELEEVAEFLHRCGIAFAEVS